MIRSTLLLCVVLTALVGVLFACETPPLTPYDRYVMETERHDEAIEQIQALGGRVQMTDPGAVVMLTDMDARAVRDALGLVGDIMLLDSIQFTRAELTRRNLRPLAGLHVRHLTVSRSPLTPDTLDALFSVTGLRSVHLIRTGAGDAVIPHLQPYDDLEVLTLAYEPITEEGIMQLADLRRLRELRLAGVDVSDEALEQLVEINTRLFIDIDEDRVIRGVDAAR